MLQVQKEPHMKLEHLLFEEFFSYVRNTESPKTYYRWALVAAIGAALGRNFYFRHGHWSIFPNIYCMLIGSPGTRKSTAIKLTKRILRESGYSTVAADRVTKEKFLVDLDGTHTEPPVNSNQPDRKTAENLWGVDADADEDPREVFIMADEFNGFIGINNIDFISLLGELWDYEGIYESKTKHGKSVRIPHPTISIIGGNTPQGFSLAFPPEIVGQGFLSRLILIYGEQTGKRIAFPVPPEEQETQRLVERFRELRLKVKGEATLTPEARQHLEYIYENWDDLPDPRFKHYSTRRFTQLLKLCCICAASRISTEITASDILYANTMLAAAEHKMPTALGEFGKSKFSDVINTILDTLNETDKPLSVKEIWAVVHKDLERPSDLAQILQSLEQAERIMHVSGKGFLPKAAKVRKQQFVDWTLLTEEERNGL